MNSRVSEEKYSWWDVCAGQLIDEKLEDGCVFKDLDLCRPSCIVSVNNSICHTYRH